MIPIEHLTGYSIMCGLLGALAILCLQAALIYIARRNERRQRQARQRVERTVLHRV